MQNASTDPEVTPAASGATPSAEEPPMFAQLRSGRTPRQRWTALGVSLGMELGILGGLLAIPATRVKIVAAVAPHTVLLFEPPPPPKFRATVPRRVPPPPKPVEVVMHRLAPPPAPVKLARVVLPPKVIKAPQPPAPKPAPAPVPVKMPEIKAPPAPVKLNSFATEAKATLPRQRADQVQTGGFGNPAGLAAKATTPNGNVAHLGTFGLPEGPGEGNGRGGSRGARGVMASGFGDAAASSGGNGPGGGGHGVELGGFGNGNGDGGNGSGNGHDTVPAPVATTPVVILYKPDPVYTPEARAARIQGEVLLQVIFGADGRLEVAGMQRGLGHGLDQQAEEVARQIRFKPATRGGEAVTTRAVLHVIFQLAE